jgi:type IV pilus biogenesis protein CpaD/CtpE
MKIRVLTFLAAVIPVLSGCADKFRLGDPLTDGGAPCREAMTADGPWRAGCATRRNMAAIAEEPGDLYIPRPETPRDAMRRDSLFRNYGRAGSSSQQTAQSQVGSGLMSQSGTGSTQ